MEEQEYKSADDTVVDNDNISSPVEPGLLSYSDIKAECAGSDDEAMFKYCFLHNIVYDHLLARRALIAAGEGEEVSDPVEIYQKLINEDDALRGHDFFS